MSKISSPAIKKLLLTVLSQGIVLSLSVITGFVLPERMGPENFGYWQIYLFYLTYLNLFGLGFNDGIALFYGGTYYDALPFQKMRASMHIVYLYQLILSVVGIGLVLIFFDCGVYQTIYLFLVINIPITCIQCIILTTFLSVGKTEFYNYINLALKVLSVAFYLVLIFSGYNDPSRMIIADTIVRIAILLICVIAGRKILFGKSAPLKSGWQELVEKSKAGFLITLAMIASMLMPVLGRSVVEHWEPIAVYGIYSFAMSLLTIILSFTNVLGTVIFPLLKRMPEDEMTKSYSKFAVICDCFVAIALFLYLPLMFIIQNIMPQYLSALNYLHFLLAMCLPLGRAQLLVTPFYKAKRLEKELFLANLIGIVAMFVSLVVSYMIFRNVTVVAICTTIILTFWTLGAELYLQQKQKSDVLRQTIAEIFIMVAFCLAGAFQSYVLFFGIYGITLILYFFFMRKDLLDLLHSQFQ